MFGAYTVVFVNAYMHVLTLERPNKDVERSNVKLRDKLLSVSCSSILTHIRRLIDRCVITNATPNILRDRLRLLCEVRDAKMALKLARRFR